MDSWEFAPPAVVPLPRPLSPPVEFPPRIPRESEKSPNPGFPKDIIRTPDEVLYRHRDGEASARVDTRGADLVREFAWEILRQFLYQFAVQAAWPAG